MSTQGLAAVRAPAPALALLVLLAGIVGCAPRVTEARTIGAFSTIGASSGVEVHVMVGGAPSASVTAAQSAMDEVTVRVEGGSLQVSSSATGRVTVDVTTPALTAIDASSSAEVTAEGVSGPTFDVNVSSQASVVVSGTTGGLRLSGSSQSRADLGQLAAETASVNLSSQARAEVRASQSVGGNVSSQAKLTIHGSPASVDVATSSEGEVVRK